MTMVVERWGVILSQEIEEFKKVAVTVKRVVRLEKCQYNVKSGS